jgi:ABC-2 type transport system permease protein
VARKEVRLFFASPVAWLFLGSFAALTLFIFFWVESWFARNIADVRPLFEWMPILLIFLSAALTMRMWSEERRSGTLEHVLTLPAGLWRFVMGKFRACLTLLVLALLATLPLPITAALIADLDWGPVAAGYLASCLLGATYISAGLFVSARTDNPIVSLIGTVLLCGGLYLVGSDLVTGFFDDQAAAWLRGLGSGARFESITRGVLDIADLAYYVSLTAVFLVLNVYLLERERWAKGAATPRHRHWRIATVLLVGNFLLMNLWLGRGCCPTCASPCLSAVISARATTHCWRHWCHSSRTSCRSTYRQVRVASGWSSSIPPRRRIWNRRPMTATAFAPRHSRSPTGIRPPWSIPTSTFL